MNMVPLASNPQHTKPSNLSLKSLSPRRNLRFLGLFAVQAVLLTFSLFNNAIIPHPYAQQINRFDDALTQGDYSGARELLNNFEQKTVGNIQVMALAKTTDSLQQKFLQFSDGVLSEGSGFATFQRMQNLRLFTAELAPVVQSESRRVAGRYIDKSLTADQAGYYFTNLDLLGFTAAATQGRKRIEPYQVSRQALAQARRFSADSDFPQSLAAYRRVLPEDAPDFQIAQAEMQKALDLMIAGYRQAQDMVPYHGPIQHIFFHPLIVYPELAFDNDSQSNGFNQYFVTVSEFKKILESLYQQNFILVDIHSIYEEKSEHGQTVIAPKQLLLPKGKKPLILSVDDLNYYRYMIQNGTARKLVLDSDGNIATYSVTPQGQTVISRANEVIPFLDQFVAEHPDFSLDGAKGMIDLTGYEGILGYRTNELTSPNYASEKAQAMTVIQRLKETGWCFAAHGWGHLDAGKISLAALMKDTQRWLTEVEPLTGPTGIYVYPFGSSVLPGDPKFQYLQDAGFHALCAVGPNPYLKFGPTYFMMDRRHIDGIALLTEANLYRDLFNSENIVDKVRPPLKP